MYPFLQPFRMSHMLYDIIGSTVTAFRVVRVTNWGAQCVFRLSGLLFSHDFHLKGFWVQCFIEISSYKYQVLRPLPEKKANAFVRHFHLKDSWMQCFVVKIEFGGHFLKKADKFLRQIAFHFSSSQALTYKQDTN